jgi:hypothetical protein
MPVYVCKSYLCNTTFGIAGDQIMKHIHLVPISLAAILLVMVGAGSSRSDAETFDHDHTLLDQVLRENVLRGRVNYRALKDSPTRLNRYLETLAAIDPRDYEHWTRQQKLALWINAYNAYTIKAIVDHYPIQPSWLADPLGHYPPDSIRQIPGVWDKMTWRVMGRDYTLDHMEHVILRKELAEPRVHFVLVCASLGCPLLESRAFDAPGLEKRLDQAAINYIYRDHKVQIDRENSIVRLPRIFEWFAEDFQVRDDAPEIFRNAPRATGYVKHSELTGKDEGAGLMLLPKNVAGPLSWIYHYANEQDRTFLASTNYRVVYLYYDWSLNEQR